MDNSLGWVSLLLALTAACSAVLAQNERPAVAYRPDTVIALETHACLGRCPVYAIEIASSGTATTIGLQYTPSKGPFTVHLTQQKVGELIHAFKEANFCKLDDSYTSKANSFISDIPGTFLSFRCGEQLKLVYDYCGTPKIVRDLEQQVEHATQLERFLFADRQTLETKFAAGLKPDSKEAQECLLKAVEWQDEDLVKYLLEKGVDPEAPLLKGSCDRRSVPLMTAVFLNDIEISRLLVHYGADAHAATGPGNATLLSDAAHHQGSPEMLSALIEMGAEVNAIDSSGSTALMYAAMRARPDLVEILLNAGAGRNLRNNDGLTALDCAKRMSGCEDDSDGGSNTLALEDDPNHKLFNPSKTIALLTTPPK